MRLWIAVGCLLLVGCAGPHSTGALWAQQNLEQELVMFRTSDTQRADQARTFQYGQADAALAVERSRVDTGLQTCPGETREPLTLSVGDRARDEIRIRAQGDSARLAATAQVALADWWLRRARATGDARMCDDARQALLGSAVEPGASDVLSSLGNATVTRDPGHPLVANSQAWSTDVTLSSYALGYVDTVQAAAPLPAYLAAVYGGVLLPGGATTPLNGQTPEVLVDRLAPAYPAWEPDALYATFTAP